MTADQTRSFLQEVKNEIMDHLTKEKLSDYNWTYSHVSGGVFSHNLRLLPDGRIGGYQSDNISAWNWERSQLLLYNRGGKLISRMDRVKSGTLAFEGTFLPRPGTRLRFEENGMIHRSRQGLNRSDGGLPSNEASMISSSASRRS